MLDPQILAQLGRRGDTMVAHISPQEAAILKMLGGSGSINPATGLPEFWDDGGNDPGGVGGDVGSGGFGGDASPGSGAEAAAAAAAAGFGMTGINESLSGVAPTPTDEGGFYEGIMDDYLTIGTLKNVPAALWDDYGPLAAGALAGPLGYAAVAGLQGKGKQAGAAAGATFGGMVAGPFGMALGGLAGYGIGGLMEGGLSAPDRSPGDDEGSPSGGGDYSAMAQNMISGLSGVSQAQTVSQPESFDRDAFSQFGQGMINQQSRSATSSAKSGSANRGMGADSGQLAGQMAIQNQQRQQKMQQWNQLMSDPNMGYNDLASSLMNILA